MGRIPSFAIGAYLIALGVGSLWLAEAAWRSVTSYDSPYKIDAEYPATRPLTSKLLLAVLDGVRVDASEGMPNFRALTERGASGVLRVGQPSLSNPGRATMATGAWPEVHGVTNNGSYRPPPVDSLLSIAARENRPRAVFGSSFWGRAFGQYIGPEYGEFEKKVRLTDGPQALVYWQRGVCGEMVEFVRRQADGLIIAGITAGDNAGHDLGGESEGYLLTLSAVDECLGKVVEAAGGVETTVVAVADHGHIHRRGHGGHGGPEPEVMNVPIAMAGPGVAAGARVEGPLTDLAPTLCALLGYPLPANSQGEPFWTALEIPDPDLRAELEQNYKAQHDRVQAEVPDHAMLVDAGRAERTPTTFAVAGFFTVLVLLTVAWDARRWKTLASAVAVFMGVYFGLFWAFALGYSLSDIVKEEYLIRFFAKDLTAACAATVAAVWALRAERRSRSLTLAVLLTSLFALRVTWVHFQTGLIMRDHMPDLDLAFMAYLDLLTIFGIGAAACAATALARKSA